MIEHDLLDGPCACGSWHTDSLPHMRSVQWPEFLTKWPALLADGGMIFLDLGLFDIPATITNAVRVLAEQKVSAVSVHPSCIQAALDGRIDGRPMVVARYTASGW